MQNTSISTFLKKIGLSETEAKVYQGLLETGQTTVQSLALHLNMRRLTVHFNVENLIAKRLVIQTQHGARRQIIAESPERLTLIIDEKAKEIEALKKDIPNIIESMHQTIPNLIARKNPIIKYYQGEKGFIDVCQRSITQSTNEVLFIQNVHEWRKVYTAEYGKKYYIPERLKKKLFLKTLAVRNESAEVYKEEDEKKLRETRYLPQEFDFKPTIIICDREISIMLSNEPYTSIVIEDKDIADMTRNIFNYLWDLSG